MKNFNKYLTSAIKHQNATDLSFNDNWNLATYGTPAAIHRLVQNCKHDAYGQLGHRKIITKKQFLAWHAEKLRQEALGVK